MPAARDRRALLGVVCAIFSATSVAHAQTAPRLTLVEDMRIDGAQEDLSGLTPQFSFASGGRIAVFNGPTASFVYFDRAGRRVGTFGRRGDGPGEFASRLSSSLSGTPELQNYISLQRGLVADTMWAYSSDQRRFTLISPDLKLVRTIPLPAFDASTLVSFRVMALLSGDRVLGQATYGQRVEVKLPNGLTGRTTTVSDSAVIVMAANGSIERRLATAPPSNAMAVHNPPGGRYSFAPVPFAHRPSVDATPSGDRVVIATTSITSATGGSLHLTAVRPSGDTIFARSYAYTSGAVTPRMADSVYERMARIYANRPELLKLVRESIPKVYPPYSQIVAGPDGAIWASRESLVARPAELLLFAPNGDLLGLATLPRTSLQLYTGSRTELWATERDADGFYSIVRFRVEPAR